MAVIATAISFLVMIIAVSVSGGFRREIRHGVSEISGDVLLTSAYFNYYSEADPIDATPSYLPRIKDLDGVVSVNPAIYRAGIVKTDGDMAGVLVKGVEKMEPGLGVDIPERLASLLGLKEGDALPTYFIGEKVKIRKFTVRSIYEDSIDAGENMLVFASLPDMQRLNGWDSTKVSAMEVILDDKFKSRSSMKEMAMEIGSISSLFAQEDEEPLVASSAVDKYSQLFDWLDLIDFNVVAILLLMTVVAGFNMISGLLILLFRHISTIGTLKSLGMGDKGIASVFLRVSARIVLMGMAAGNALALAFCLVQNSTHLIKLNPENYFVAYVPVSVNAGSVLLADALSFAVIMLLLLIPCLFISKVDPSETMKTE